jgi:hypothetical protein
MDCCCPGAEYRTSSGGFNETSDRQYGPADRSAGHYDSARHRGGLCRGRLHVHIGNTILTASAFDCACEIARLVRGYAYGHG